MLGLETGEVAEVEVQRRRGPSIVWLIPLVAAGIGAWLAYTTIMEQGPTIEITFENADGLEAGKTKIQYKEVEIGLVDKVVLSEDLANVIATASMVADADPYLGANSRFWVVRPRIGAGGVSGLGTLVSGAYIAIDPGEGDVTTRFTGLEEPPAISSDVPGTRFRLRAERLGSVVRGAPLYYRDLEVGQVLDFKLAPNQRQFDIEVFVNAPHDALVRAVSRFWNASGIDVSLGADGVDVSVASLQTLLAGGIAFDTPGIDAPGEPAAEGTDFRLFASFQQIGEAGFTQKIPYLVYFDGSVRGLSPGAPVEFRGMQVGRVTGVHLEYDPAADKLQIPVALEIEPERVRIIGPDGAELDSPSSEYDNMDHLVARGLRAQLASGNLLTGEMLIALDFHPNAPPAELIQNGAYPVIPSIPTEIEELTASVTGILDRLAALPLDALVADIRRTVQSVETLVGSPATQESVAALGEAAVSLKAVATQLEAQIGPLLTSANATMAAADGLIGDNSDLRFNADQLLREAAGAARAVRIFADYLERHPEALLRGKGGQ